MIHSVQFSALRSIVEKKYGMLICVKKFLLPKKVNMLICVNKCLEEKKDVKTWNGSKVVLTTQHATDYAMRQRS